MVILIFNKIISSDGELIDKSIEVAESEESDESKFRCKHYKRKCQFVVS